MQRSAEQSGSEARRRLLHWNQRLSRFVAGSALGLAPPRHPAQASAACRWRAVRVDHDDNTVFRPPGVKLDTGGIAQGLLADIVADTLRGHASFAVSVRGTFASEATAG